MTSGVSSSADGSSCVCSEEGDSSLSFAAASSAALVRDGRFLTFFSDSSGASLKEASSAASFAGAGVEGVASSLRPNREVAQEAGASAGTLRAMGGAANSRLWTQIKADITGKSIQVPASDAATSLGAALLAGVGVGAYRDFDQAVAATVRVTREHTPNPEHRQAYEQGYRLYRQLYEDLKDTMRKEAL